MTRHKRIFYFIINLFFPAMVASGAKTPFELCAFNAFVAEAQLKPVVLLETVQM